MNKWMNEGFLGSHSNLRTFKGKQWALYLYMKTQILVPLDGTKLILDFSLNEKSKDSSLIGQNQWLALMYLENGALTPQAVQGGP